MTQIISLTPRLAAIYKEYVAANKDYDIIWDTCCDHGYLGQKILASNPRGKIIFVDQVPSITNTLNEYLQSQYYANYAVYTQDLAELQLAADKSHLVIIAGIGGELIAELLSRLLVNNNASIDFIFCPSTSVYSLRDYLSSNNFGLLSEGIVADNNRFYEVIYVRYNAIDSECVSLLGGMWNSNDSDHQHYLNNLITLYETRLMGSKAAAAQEILTLYQQCYHRIFS
jgi:tRNA (adenine22-N1)-methyltransferase